MSLTLSAQPGFTELADALFDTGATPSDATLKAANSNSKFAAVRNEQFWGFYEHGDTVLLPVSPADGYEYSREELVYSWSIYSSAPPTGAFTAGQQATPTAGANSGAGTLLGVNANVDQTTGVVSLTVAYWNGSQTNTTDGILMVIAHAQRSR